MSIGHPCIGIADDAALQSQGWDISRGLDKGVVRKFGDLQKLAAAYEIPQDELAATVNRFNRYVTTRHDEEFEKPILPDAVPLSQTPYYAIRLWPKVHFTMGGVQINIRAQVINLDQEPVKGLYAAGEVTGGIHGACRLGSCAITECLVFGRIAGSNAASEIS